MTKDGCKISDIMNVLPGVEFDVLFEKDMSPCHIITIFNGKTSEELLKIKTSIEDNLLTKKDDYYNLGTFENILRKIDLSVILIVCQRLHYNKQNLY